MAFRPSSVAQRLVLPSPLASSLPNVPDPKSYLARAASPTLVDFAAACRLDYFESLVSDSDCPLFVGGELALGCHVLEDRLFELECLTTVVPHLAAMLLAPEGEPDALDTPTLRSYAEAITGQ
ncbi:unnamed protein product [Closterium sp. NIES-54]